MSKDGKKAEETAQTNETVVEQAAPVAIEPTNVTEDATASDDDEGEDSTDYGKQEIPFPFSYENIRIGSKNIHTTEYSNFGLTYRNRKMAKTDVPVWQLWRTYAKVNPSLLSLLIEHYMKSELKGFKLNQANINHLKAFKVTDEKIKPNAKQKTSYFEMVKMFSQEQMDWLRGVATEFIANWDDDFNPFEQFIISDGTLKEGDFVRVTAEQLQPIYGVVLRAAVGGWVTVVAPNVEFSLTHGATVKVVDKKELDTELVEYLDDKIKKIHEVAHDKREQYKNKLENSAKQSEKMKNRMEEDRKLIEKATKELEKATSVAAINEINTKLTSEVKSKIGLRTELEAFSELIGKKAQELTKKAGDKKPAPVSPVAKTADEKQAVKAAKAAHKASKKGKK